MSFEQAFDIFFYLSTKKKVYVFDLIFKNQVLFDSFETRDIT